MRYAVPRQLVFEHGGRHFRGLDNQYVLTVACVGGG